MTKTTRIYNNRKSGIYIHPYRQVCMGRCRFCRDPDKEPKVIRKRRHQELILTLKKEGDAESNTLMSEISTLRKILTSLPESHVIERESIKGRIEKIEKELG